MKSLRVISLLFCLGLCLGFAAYGQTVKEKESRKARLEKEIALLDKQIRDNAARGADALSRLSLVREERYGHTTRLRFFENAGAQLEDEG